MPASHAGSRPDPGQGHVDEGTAARRAEARELLEDDRLVARELPVVPSAGDLPQRDLGVLVGQRHPEVGGIDRAEDGLDVGHGPRCYAVAHPRLGPSVLPSPVLPVIPGDAGLPDIGVDRGADRREEGLGPERIDQAVPPQAVLDRILELGEAQADATGLEGGDEFGQRVGGGHVDVGDGFGGDHHAAGRRRCLGHGGLDLVAEHARVREEERRVPAEQDQAIRAVRLGVAGDVVIPLDPVDPARGSPSTVATPARRRRRWRARPRGRCPGRPR